MKNYLQKAQLFIELRKIFRGNLNKAISLREIHVTFKVTSTSVNEIVSFRFSRNIFFIKQIDHKSEPAE